jgi:hypothetical protein
VEKRIGLTEFADRSRSGYQSVVSLTEYKVNVALINTNTKGLMIPVPVIHHVDTARDSHSSCLRGAPEHSVSTAKLCSE